MSLSVGGYPQSYPQPHHHHHPHLQHPQTPHSYLPHTPPHHLHQPSPHHTTHPHHSLQNGGMPSVSPPAAIPQDIYNTYNTSSTSSSASSAAHQIPRYLGDPYHPHPHQQHQQHHHQHHPHQHDTASAATAAAAAAAVTGHTAAAAAVAAGGYFPNWMLPPHTDIPTVSGHIPDGYHSFGPPASNSPGGTPYQSFIQYENGVPIRCIKRRVTANKKERRRTLSINNAFSQLRGCIPNVPSDTKLSKIKTLRLATSYISYLMDILSKDEPDNMSRTGFKADLTKKPPGGGASSNSQLTSQVPGVDCGLKTDASGAVGMSIHGRSAVYDRTDDKRKRESDGESEASSHGSSPCPEKKTKGRTGWPQHVWASELK